MTSQFIEQVQILMHAQQTKYSENLFGKSHYTWLRNRKPTFVWMTTKDEFIMRRALNKLKEEQRLKVMKQLITWLEEHPNVSSLKVPEMCIQLLSKMETSSVMHSITITRMGSFRNSLRRFSILRNKVTPTTLGLPANQNQPRRSVTFNDEPIIYCIYN